MIVIFFFIPSYLRSSLEPDPIQLKNEDGGGDYANKWLTVFISSGSSGSRQDSLYSQMVFRVKEKQNLT